jgi:PBP1b-binding outer membrane lipoprotein LpoB
MKKIIAILSFSVLLLQGCFNPYYDEVQEINLGVESTTTNIKSVFQNENVVIIEFETTIGSKYSIQIVPFGQETPIKKEGFTATNTVTQRVYDLSEESRGYYDLIFLDISGKEIKYPIIIK